MISEKYLKFNFIQYLYDIFTAQQRSTLAKFIKNWQEKIYRKQFNCERFQHWYLYNKQDMRTIIQYLQTGSERT